MKFFCEQLNNINPCNTQTKMRFVCVSATNEYKLNIPPYNWPDYIREYAVYISLNAVPNGVFVLGVHKLQKQATLGLSYTSASITIDICLLSVTVSMKTVVVLWVSAAEISH